MMAVRDLSGQIKCKYFPTYRQLEIILIFINNYIQVSHVKGGYFHDRIITTPECFNLCTSTTHISNEVIVLKQGVCLLPLRFTFGSRRETSVLRSALSLPITATSR